MIARCWIFHCYVGHRVSKKDDPGSPCWPLASPLISGTQRRDSHPRATPMSQSVCDWTRRLSCSRNRLGGKKGNWWMKCFIMSKCSMFPHDLQQYHCRPEGQLS